MFVSYCNRTDNDSPQSTITTRPWLCSHWSISSRNYKDYKEEETPWTPTGTFLHNQKTERINWILYCIPLQCVKSLQGDYDTLVYTYKLTLKVLKNAFWVTLFYTYSRTPFSSGVFHTAQVPRYSSALKKYENMTTNENGHFLWNTKFFEI